MIHEKGFLILIEKNKDTHIATFQLMGFHEIFVLFLEGVVDDIHSDSILAYITMDVNDD